MATRLRIVSSSTFKRGFSSTKVRQVINTVGNLDLIVNTPIITASLNTAWDVWLGILTIVAMVSVEIAIHSSDILNAQFSDAVPDIFDTVVAPDQQADLELLYPDDGEWPSTPNLVDNLNTTPARVDALSTSIRTQIHHLTRYIKSFIEPLL